MKRRGISPIDGRPVEITVADGRISSVEPCESADHWIAPGLIDVQVNGFAGVDYNSPDTPLFDKSRTLYGLFEARQQPGRPERIIVVEGYVDVIALDQRGTWGTEPYLVCPDSWDYPLDRPSEPETLGRQMRRFMKF